MSGPLLKKIKVLEMAHVISGPYAGMLLADLGADVIKVEMPGTGDYFRLWDGKDEAIRPSFAAYNRGKRSVPAYGPLKYPSTGCSSFHSWALSQNTWSSLLGLFLKKRLTISASASQ